MSGHNVDPVVSVVMPTYNRANYIGASIESVLKQTVSDLELIIVDNYSTDGTEAVVAQYRAADCRIRYLKCASKGIIAAVRNHGIKHARGEYVAFLDSDDLWLPEKLEWQLAAFAAQPRTGLVYTAYQPFDEQGACHPHVPHRGFSGNVSARLVKGNFIGCSTVMIRREVFDRVGFFNEDAELVAVEDYQLWVRVSFHYPFAFVDRVLMHYRVHEQNISSGGSARTIALVVKALQSVFGCSEIPRKLRERTLSHWYAISGRNFLYRHDYDQFRRYCHQSLQLRFNLPAALGIVLDSLLGAERLVVFLNGLRSMSNRMFRKRGWTAPSIAKRCR